MDMYDTYLRIAKIYFNNAIIAVDSFHVLQNLIRAFEKVRNKFLRKYDNGSDELEDNSEEYYLLKKGKDLLTVIHGNLSTEPKYNRKLHMHISDRTFVNYILNSFISVFDHNKMKYRILSDGPIEGLNSQIQKIHMNSNCLTK